MDNRWLIWHAINETDRTSYHNLIGLIPFTIGAVEVALFLTIAFLLPLACLLFDVLTSRRSISRLPVMIDPKGFTTNDLIMLNLKQEKTLEKADVRECGSINVLASTAIPLPPVIARQQKRQIDTLFDQANVKEEPNPLSFVHIEEYRDNTFLTANAEGELTTNMEQVKTDHSTEKEKESGSFVNNDIPP